MGGFGKIAIMGVAAGVAALAVAAFVQAQAPQARPGGGAAATQSATATTAHAFTFEGLLDGEIRLADHRGKAMLVVNTATECGFTPQLEGLQALHAARAKDGLVVIGVPSNDFGGQEPRQGQEIAEYCRINYGVDFPMATRSVVTGPQAHPFYRWAAQRYGASAVPRWNFHKLVFDKDGELVEAFDSRVRPDDPRLKAAIDRALAG